MKLSSEETFRTGSARLDELGFTLIDVDNHYYEPHDHRSPLCVITAASVLSFLAVLPDTQGVTRLDPMMRPGVVRRLPAESLM